MENRVKLLPTMDLLFKKLLCSKDSTHILKAFIRDILGKEFKSLKPRETYHIDSYKKAYDENPELMRTEVDILAEIEDGSHVTIEMQIQPHEYFIERSLFYLLEAFRSSLGNQETEDFIKSNNFSALRPAYGINIIDFHLFEQDGAAIRKFGLLDLSSHKPLPARQGDELIMLCFFSLKNRNIDRNSPAYLWHQFFKTGEVPEDAPNYLKEAQKKTDYYSLNEEEQKMIMDMNKAKMINDAVLSTAVRKAREEVKAEAKAEKLEIALNLLKIGLSTEQVADSTKLTIEEVEKLRKTLV